MANRFVRSSKYRHVFGRPTRKEQCYDNLRISRNAWDTNLVKVNPQYISVNWEASGGGAFAVIPINEKGRLPEHFPLFRGHTAAVLDTDWNPFNDFLIASGSDDGKIFLWRVPEGFTLQSDAEEVADIAPVGKLSGHSRKVGHVLFNPAAENVLATASGDFTIKLWDIEAGSSKLTLKHGDIVQSLSWSANGSLLVTTSRDKKLRIWDVRQEKPAQEVQGHLGAKNSRAVWMGEHERIATTGFSRMSDRQLALWDMKAPREPLGGFQRLDSISGVCMPFWDDGTQCLYLAGKGDGNIRYYEYENDKFEYLSEYSSGSPQRGMAFLPKRGINMHENEVMRAFKTVNDTYIEPVSFIVPRRAEVFQSDIYPPATGLKPAMSSGEWFAGKEALPSKIDMERVYEGGAPTEVPGDYKPPAQTAPVKAPEPVKKEVESARLDPVAAAAQPAPVSKGPPPSMKEQSGSIAAMADKYADKDDEKAEEEEDDSSSFEEVAKPAERPVNIKLEPAKVEQSITSPPGLWKGAKKSEAAPAAAQEEAPKDISEPVSATPQTSTPAAASPPSSAHPVHREIQTIKSLIEQQSQTISAQDEQIKKLTAEIETLKTKV